MSSKQKPLLQKRRKNIWGIIFLFIAFSILAIILYNVSFSKKEYIEQSKIFNGQLYSANHAANLLDKIDIHTNVAISPLNYNASMAILYNITDNNSNKEIKKYFQKNVETVNVDIKNQYQNLYVNNKFDSNLSNIYTSLYKELENSNYIKLTTKDIESLPDIEKEKLYLLTKKLELTYSAIIGNNKHNEKTIKNYTIKEKDMTHNSYTIFILLQKVLDEYESYSIENKIINVNQLYYKKNIMNFSKVDKNNLKNVQKYYNIEFEEFENTEDYQNKINSEFNRLTDYKVIRTVENTDLNNDYIFLNILYFNYKWETNITTKNVSDGIFYINEEQEHIVEYMYDKVDVYMENDYAKAFKKDFEEGKYSFVGILPKTQGDFILSSLDIDTLLKKQTSTEKILISIPKFSYQSNNDLKRISESNGVKEIFTKKANFSKLTENNLYIQNMKQNIHISIAEKGTEKTNIKENSLSTFTIDEAQKEVLLNRPFAYLIIDNETNNVLIIGKVIKP